MVYKRDIPSSSTRDILDRGTKKEMELKAIEQLIDVLLRSSSIYQDGGQVPTFQTFLRRALAEEISTC